jgi:hypothetical protein
LHLRLGSGRTFRQVPIRIKHLKIRKLLSKFLGARFCDGDLRTKFGDRSYQLSKRAPLGRFFKLFEISFPLSYFLEFDWYFPVKAKQVREVGLPVGALLETRLQFGPKERPGLLAAGEICKHGSKA